MRLGIERLCEKIDRHNEQTAESHRRTARDIGECMGEDLYKPMMQAMEGRTKYDPCVGYNSGRRASAGSKVYKWTKTGLVRIK